MNISDALVHEFMHDARFHNLVCAVEREITATPTAIVGRDLIRETAIRIVDAVRTVYGHRVDPENPLCDINQATKVGQLLAYLTNDHHQVKERVRALEKMVAGMKPCTWAMVGARRWRCTTHLREVEIPAEAIANFPTDCGVERP